MRRVGLLRLRLGLGARGLGVAAGDGGLGGAVRLGDVVEDVEEAGDDAGVDGRVTVLVVLSLVVGARRALESSKEAAEVACSKEKILA